MQGLLAEYEKGQSELRSHIHSILWHMRSIGREEAWTLSPAERKDIMKMVEERIKIVEKTGLALL